MSMETECNYTPLSPQSFLRRNARVFPEKPAIIYGNQQVGYAEFFERSCRQANGLRALGIGQGDRVAVLAPNTPAHLEANFGVHMAGAALVAINTRLSPPEIAFIVNHCGARVMIVDRDLLPAIQPVVAEMKGIERFVVVR
ncbi:MAG: AMP-binding protein, partial [bacterium]